MGIAYNNKGDYNRAKEAYQKAIEINLQKDEDYYWLGKLGEIIKSYIKDININPNRNEAYINLFELQLIQTNPLPKH